MALPEIALTVLSINIVLSIVILIFLFHIMYVINIIKNKFPENISSNYNISKSNMGNNKNNDPLTEAGWVLYAAEWCGWCKKQIEELKQNYPEFLNKENNVIYNGVGINGFPTWKNTKTGKVLSGYKSADQLREMIKLNQL